MAEIQGFEDLGLSVHGVGKINLPLQEEQAPYGKGSDTIVDTAVRNTWELDASQLEFHGDAYERTLNGAVNFVHSTLGITTPIRAELYKMLIYEKGAMFRAHTESDTSRGDAVVKHCGQTNTFSTAAAQPSVLCWYSDVHHEVLPVTSGYRCVLTFNLAILPGFDAPGQPAERPSAAQLQNEHQELRTALQRWLLDCGQQQDDSAQSSDNHIYYLLEHEYTEASISLKALKLQDLARVQCLMQLTKGLEFDIFLAVLEKTQEGGVEMDWSRHGYKRKWYEDVDEDDGGGGKNWHELDQI
ncbi:uncharacterized protein B0T15DRAFT_513491 [Chaetomium strumarium]|uniref:Prolyl 4-hydroxylase alpha subunit Fe(2+) 2OG dioxygenase domain-containing protein n=1 Tax=Chaetomium strumarium TaxID=1170767 RepID=A0AAJ0GNQ4_9PEZI|nr:hypothetical protein B0T15DRAFT_513491 [Chaetomium strumarium]